MRRYRVAIALAVLLLAGGLGGCGQSAAPGLSFMYWSDYSMAKAPLTMAVARFKKAHQDLTVSQSTTPYGGTYYQKLLILFGAQSAPDTFLIAPPNFAQYASRGGMQDLTSRVQAAIAARQLSITKDQLATCTLNGKVYGLPAGRACLSISNQSKHVDAAWDLIKDLVAAGFSAD